MKICFKKVFLMCALLASAATAAVAQQTTSGDEGGKNEFSFWGGFSPDSNTFIKATGRTPDARFGIVNFRYARRFNNSDSVNLKYTADFTPFAALNYPDFNYVQTGTSVFRAVSATRPTRYAFGISPLGLQANFRPRKKTQPFVDATGGFLYFNKRTPNVVGTRFAFTADIGGGIEYQMKGGRSVTFGYKYFHISNGNRGQENPGFDNNLFYVGYTFLKK